MNLHSYYFRTHCSPFLFHFLNFHSILFFSFCSMKDTTNCLIDALFCRLHNINGKSSMHFLCVNMKLIYSGYQKLLYTNYVIILNSNGIIFHILFIVFTTKILFFKLKYDSQTSISTYT